MPIVGAQVISKPSDNRLDERWRRNQPGSGRLPGPLSSPHPDSATLGWVVRWCSVKAITEQLGQSSRRQRLGGGRGADASRCSGGFRSGGGALCHCGSAWGYSDTSCVCVCVKHLPSPWWQGDRGKAGWWPAGWLLFLGKTEGSAPLAGWLITRSLGSSWQAEKQRCRNANGPFRHISSYPWNTEFISWNEGKTRRNVTISPQNDPRTTSLVSIRASGTSCVILWRAPIGPRWSHVVISNFNSQSSDSPLLTHFTIILTYYK